MTDTRIWNPDETCLPFILEQVITNVNCPIFRYRVPDNHTQVITAISVGGAQFGPIEKFENRIIVKRQKATNFALSNDTGIIIHGALTNVEELDDIQRNISGLIISGASQSVRPCRILLGDGYYEWFSTGTVSVVIELSITGYVFPNRPRE